MKFTHQKHNQFVLVWCEAFYRKLSQVVKCGGFLWLVEPCKTYEIRPSFYSHKKVSPIG